MTRFATTAVEAMHMSHPVFGDFITSNRLVRGGRWLFRGTIVPLDDVLADLSRGMSLQGVWEKHGALDRRDLKAVVELALGEHARALRDRSADLKGNQGRREAEIHLRRRFAA